MVKVTKKKLTEMKRQISTLYREELDIRQNIRTIYDQLILDVGDDRLAQRYVRLAYFEIQKERFRELLQDRLEFHPFFTAGIEYDFDDEDEDEEEGDGLN